MKYVREMMYLYMVGGIFLIGCLTYLKDYFVEMNINTTTLLESLRNRNKESTLETISEEP